MSRSLPQIFCTLDQLPANLPADRRYVSWRYEQRHDQLTKVPLVPGQSQRRASVTAPATWGSFADARADVEQRRAHGLGLVLTGDITVVDLDACVDPGTGAVTPLATLVLGQLRSYSERSPSGTGLHILGRGSLPPGRRRMRGLEVYDNRRFITLTGARVVGTPHELVELTSELSLLHSQLFPRQPQVSRVPAVSEQSSDGQAVVAAAMAARNGAKFRALWNGDIAPYSSASEADAALCACLAFWCARNPERVEALFRQSALYRPSKWHSRRGDCTYGWRTVLFACAVTTDVYTPNSLADDVEVPHDLSTEPLPPVAKSCTSVPPVRTYQDQYQLPVTKGEPMAKRSARATATPNADADDVDVTPELHGTFLKGVDVKEGPLTFQISHVERTLFDARGDEPARTKIVVTLEGEPVRKLALNKTNLEVFCEAWGKKGSGWIGKAFDAYFDPDVRDLHGKRTGGLRVRPRPSKPRPTGGNGDGGDGDGGVPF